MFYKILIGLTVLSLLTGTASGMSMLPRFGGSKNVVPMKEEKSERTIRCKGKLQLTKDGKVIGCEEGFYLDESSMNKEERKASIKEKLLGFLGNLKGFFFWMLLASIGASLLGFGGVVTTIWSNLFGTGIKMSKALVRGIRNMKRNGKTLTGAEKEQYDRFVKELMNELEKEQLREGVKKNINKIRAKIEE